MENPPNFQESKMQIVKIEEMVEFINKLGLRQVDKTQIESTESDIIVELLCSVFDKMGIIKRETLKISFQGQNHFEYLHLHDRPIYIMKLFNYSKSFVKEVLKVENYISADLFTPKPLKTKKILNSLINYDRFKKSQKGFYQTMRSDFENSLGFYNKASEECRQERANLDKLM
jgi:hypothetical protein